MQLWVYFPCWCLLSKPSRAHFRFLAAHMPPTSDPALSCIPTSVRWKYGLLILVRETDTDGSAKRGESLQSHYRNLTSLFRTLSATGRVYMCGSFIHSVSLRHVTQYTMKGISIGLREQQPETKVRRSRGQPVPAMTSGQQPAVERAATEAKKTK